MKMFMSLGLSFLFAMCLSLTGCDRSADDHGHVHDGEAAHQHDGVEEHDENQSAPETEVFYADEDELVEQPQQSEKADNHEHGEHGHNH